jgi:hypothetical protein
MALTARGAATLTFGYERTGQGWAAQRHHRGQITWTPLSASRAGTGSVMTREAAARVALLLRERYPAGDVRVRRVFGGLHVEVHYDNSSLFAVISGEDSPVLNALREIPAEPAPT